MKVLVLGDSCEDIFEYGKCTRLCPDAPVPVFLPTSTKVVKGMAGNVANNLVNLGVEITLRTNDEKITKKRIVDEKTNQMLVRIDSGEEKINRVTDLVGLNFDSYDAIVISDYDKGFLFREDISYICQHHPLVFMDTKKKLGDWCSSCEFIKINEVEYELSKDFIEDTSSSWIRNKLIVTTGPDGCRHREKNYPVLKVEIKDLVGAGDTFLASLTAKYLQTGDIDESIGFANRCATYVVQQRGVMSITTEYNLNRGTGVPGVGK
jgi:D-beta-D-heptose 7-phosphate kinase/D-beta-D-heptose 1-phosphate adenosyltransferase